VLRLALVAAMLGPGLRLCSDTPRETQLRAVLLLNLCRFVQWPESAFASTNAPLVFGVLGRDDYVPLLEEVTRDEEVHHRRIVIARYASVHDATNCHLLFIGSIEQRDMSAILAPLRDRPILTVSDAERFTRYGGIVKLFTKPDGKTGLRINAAAAKAAELTISAMLLRVAEIVNQEDD
jgi:hypothetical protein